MSGQPRIDALRHAANVFGEESIANTHAVSQFGNAVIDGFAAYLGPEPYDVVGVPPHGDWNPERGDCRDAKFSFYGSRLLDIEPIDVGVGPVRRLEGTRLPIVHLGCEQAVRN